MWESMAFKTSVPDWLFEWHEQIRAGSIASFPFLDEHFQTQWNEFSVGIINNYIIEHLDIFSAESKFYFDDALLDVLYHRDPLNAEVEHAEDKAENLAELKFSKAIELAFNKKKDVSSF